MATSLYDQFHSDTNINHVFKLLNDLIQKQTGQSIINNINYSNYYRNSLRDIFVQSDKDTMEGLNRDVLTHNLRYFLNILKPNPVQEMNVVQETKVVQEMKPVERMETKLTELPEPPKETNVMDDYSKFMESRNEEIKLEDMVNKKETMLETVLETVLEKPNIVETIVEKKEDELEYELEVNILTMENVLRNMYNYYIIHKLNKEEIDTIYNRMIKDGYSFIKIPRDTKGELIYELNIRLGEEKEKEEEETQEIQETQEGL